MKFTPLMGAILVGLARSTEPPVMSRLLTVLDPIRLERLQQRIWRNRFEEFPCRNRVRR